MGELCSCGGHIADGKHALDRRAHMFVDGDAPAIEFECEFPAEEASCGRGASGGYQHGVRLDAEFAAFCAVADAQRAVRRALDRLYERIGHDGATALLGCHREALAELAIHGRQNARGGFEDGDLGSEGGVDSRELHADHAAPNDHETVEFGHGFEQIVRGEHAVLVDAGDRGHRGVGAGRDDEVVGGKLAHCAVGRRHRDGAEPRDGSRAA